MEPANKENREVRRRNSQLLNVLPSANTLPLCPWRHLANHSLSKRYIAELPTHVNIPKNNITQPLTQGSTLEATGSSNRRRNENKKASGGVCQTGGLTAVAREHTDYKLLTGACVSNYNPVNVNVSHS